MLHHFERCCCSALLCCSSQKGFPHSYTSDKMSLMPKCSPTATLPWKFSLHCLNCSQCEYIIYIYMTYMLLWPHHASLLGRNFWTPRPCPHLWCRKAQQRCCLDQQGACIYWGVEQQGEILCSESHCQMPTHSHRSRMESATGQASPASLHTCSHLSAYIHTRAFPPVYTELWPSTQLVNPTG